MRNASGSLHFPALMRALLLSVIAVAVASTTVRAQSMQTPCGACVTPAVTPSQALAIAALGESLSPLTVLISASGSPLTALADALDALGGTGAHTGFVVRLDQDSRPIAALARGRIALFDLTAADIDAAAAFALKTAATAVRAAGATRVGVIITAPQSRDLATQGLAPYSDFLVLARPNGSRAPIDEETLRSWPAGTERWAEAPASDPFDLTRLLTTASVDRAAGVLVALAPGQESLAPLLARLAALVPAGLAPLPDVRITCDGPCIAEAWLDASTLGAVALVQPRGVVSRIRVVPGAARVSALVPSRLGLVPQLGQAHAWELTANGNELTLPGISDAIVLRIEGWQGRTEETFATGVEVTASRTLKVEEILARHQAARARQEAVVRSLISGGTTALTFDAPGFSAPVTVTAETNIYTSEAGTEVEQRNIRVNGLALATRGDETPRLPIIEAERVATPPLVIALNEAYIYRLDGHDSVQSRPCYVVAFDPRTSDKTLFAGRAWIDGATFGVVRMEATQTALPGPVVASRQRDDFEPAVEQGVTIWLPARSEINQTYETANYSTPIRRVVTLPRHLVNPPDFAARLDAAHASDAVMMRDTPGGYRYLRRARKGEKSRTRGRTLVKDQAQRVLTIAGGVTIDPNISQPLVFAGLSYLDFDLFGRGAQLDGFFGGLYGRLAWASPPLGGSAWRASGDAFGIAVSYNDRAFRDGIEQYPENISQRPFHASAGVVGPLAAGIRLRAAYELDYTAYARSGSTARDFIVPASTPVHGLRVTIERQRGPWTVSGWWNGALRQHWIPWGPSADRQEAIRAFQRFGVRAARSFVWSPRAVGRAEALWMDGVRLDRFSRYAFGTFDNPLRGYPTASIRYDRGFVLRTTASWTAAAHLRLDGFADLALVRDAGLSTGARGFPGIGAGIEAPLPFSLLTAVEWGYGFAGRNTDGTTGTQVLRVSVYKVF